MIRIKLLVFTLKFEEDAAVSVESTTQGHWISNVANKEIICQNDQAIL